MLIVILKISWKLDHCASVSLDFDGLFISNGPGNPEYCKETVERIRKVACVENPNLSLGFVWAISFYLWSLGQRHSKWSKQFVHSFHFLQTSKAHFFRIVHPKMKILSCTHPLVIPNLNAFLFCGTKLRCWEPINIEAHWLPLYEQKKIDITSNVIFYVPQNKVIQICNMRVK